MSINLKIVRSKLIYEKFPHHLPLKPSHLFSNSVQWLHNYNKLLSTKNNTEFNQNINYGLYGLLKYGSSLFFSLLFFKLTLHYAFSFLPFTILIFYLVEVHFLFLFPLLLEKNKSPIKTSCLTVYQIGLLKTTFFTLQLASFMLYGLLNLKDPLKNWKIGCITLLIYYHENRNRLY